MSKDFENDYGSFEEWEDEEYELYDYEKKQLAASGGNKGQQKKTGSCCFILLAPVFLAGALVFLSRVLI